MAGWDPLLCPVLMLVVNSGVSLLQGVSTAQGGRKGLAAERAEEQWEWLSVSST